MAKAQYDPYREALVLETETIWPEELAPGDPEERRRIEAALHREPARCANVDYLRLHTGFRRQITVAPEDLERLGFRPRP